MLLKLLQIGIPYDSVHGMGEEEINMIIGISLAVQQYQEEQSSS
jgi:hypothetical protein